MKNNFKERDLKFDFIKMICIFMVIITHVSFSDNQKSCFVFPYFIYMAVPVFMIISGYMNAKSWDKKNIQNIKTWFSKKIFLSKVITILIPFTVIFIIEFFLIYFIQNIKFSPLHIAYYFITGGLGPGSYYFPVLIQMFIFFPFVFKVYLWDNLKGGIIIISVQLIFEIGIQFLGISESIYRLLFFRYLIYILLGIILYQNRQKISKYIEVILLFIGAILVYIYNYADYNPVVFKFWTNTSMPVALWAFGLITVSLRIMQSSYGFLNFVINQIGQSTYHIFLFQMIYYALGAGNLVEPLWLRIFLNIFICCLVGVAFQYAETIIKEKLRLKW